MKRARAVKDHSSARGKKRATQKAAENGRKLCGHCNQLLGKSQYQEHRKKFYDSVSRKWNSIPSTCVQSERIQRNTPSPTSRNRKCCGHCNKVLGKTQYFEHKKLFYNESTKHWIIKECEPTLSTDSIVRVTVAASSSSSESEGKYTFIFIIEVHTEMIVVLEI